MVRNGRVIEEFSKDFFQAKNKDGSTYQSYPVEGPKLNARIVGSLDISFCPTEPEKSEFDKEDKNWKAVYDSIAGRGMQPKLADEEWKDEGGFISTDLTKMVRTWGSSNFSAPFSKFLLNLVPGKVNKNTDGSPRIHPKTNLPHMNVDFSTPKKNAKMFYEGKKEWQDDEKWYQEVMDSEDWSAEQWYQNWKKENGIIDPEPEECEHGKDPQKCIICKKKGKKNVKCKHGFTEGKCPICSKKRPEHWKKDDLMTRDYVCAGNKFKVEAYVDSKIKNNESPMNIEREKGTEWVVSFKPDHELFSMFKEDPIDYLLLEIASHSARQQKVNAFPLYLQLKQTYCPEQKLDAKSIEEKAEEFLIQLREKLVELKLKGEWYSDDLRNQVIERFELDHQSVELGGVPFRWDIR